MQVSSGTRVKGKEGAKEKRKCRLWGKLDRKKKLLCRKPVFSAQNRGRPGGKTGNAGKESRQCVKWRNINNES